MPDGKTIIVQMISTETADREEKLKANRVSVNYSFSGIFACNATERQQNSGKSN